MTSKVEKLLQETYKKMRSRSKEEDKEAMKKYRELAEDFEKRLEEVFGNSPFTKKLIIAHKDKFEDLDQRYKEIFKTEYSLFGFEQTLERLGNLISMIGIKRLDLKFESGPKGMIFWFETK